MATWTWTKRGTPVHSTTAAVAYTVVDAGTPTANRLLVAKVVGRGNETAPDSFAGYGVTWTLLGALGDASACWQGIYVALSGASPDSTDPVATWPSNRTGAHVVVYEVDVDSLDWTGTVLSHFADQGGGVYIVSASGTATSRTLTLGAPVAATSRPFACFEHGGAEEDTTERANWTELDDGTFASPFSCAEDQTRLDAFETTATATWTTNARSNALACEIIPPTGAQTVTGVALTITPSLPAGSLRIDLAGVALTITPSLPAGSLTHEILGVALSVVPILPAGSIAHEVSGVALSITPSLPAGSLTHEVLGVALAITPSLPAGSLTHEILGVALTITPSLPAAALTVEQTLTGVVLSITPSLPAGSLTHELGGIVLTITPGLPAGIVRLGDGPFDVLRAKLDARYTKRKSRLPKFGWRKE